MNIFNPKINTPSNLFIVLILSIVIILYVKTLSYELIFLDDDTLIYEKFADRSLIEKVEHAFTWNYLGGQYYRPITLITFILEEEIGNKAFFIYHLTNFLIHLLTSLCLFLVLKNIGYTQSTSFIATLFFSINPIHINAIGWVAGRGDLLAGFFSICGFYIFLKFLRHSDLKIILTVVLLLLLAILSKEVAMIIPFLFFIYYFTEKKELSLNKNVIGIFILIVTVMGVYYLLRGVLLTEVHVTKFSFTTFYRNVLVLPETVSKFFVPTGIKALPGIELFTSISGIVILAVLILIPYKIKVINKYRYYFGLAWFVLLMIPGMVFRTMEQDGFFYWDCRSYLPSIGLIIMAAAAFNSFTLNKHKSKYFTLVMIYILVLGVATFIKIDLYKNPFTYWSSVTLDYPGLFLPHIALYNYYVHNQEPDNAEKELLKGINKNPRESSIRKMLIDFYIRNDQKSKAYSEAKEFLDLKIPGSLSIFNKFIPLIIELDYIEEVDNLLQKYSIEEATFNKINILLVNEIKKLEKNADTVKANILKQLINEYNSEVLQ